MYKIVAAFVAFFFLFASLGMAPAMAEENSTVTPTPTVVAEPEAPAEVEEAPVPAEPVEPQVTQPAPVEAEPEVQAPTPDNSAPVEENSVPKQNKSAVEPPEVEANVSTQTEPAPTQKMVVCHVPPGNPDNTHAIKPAQASNHPNGAHGGDFVLIDNYTADENWNSVKDGYSAQCLSVLNPDPEPEPVCTADFERGEGTADDMWEITWGRQVGSTEAAAFTVDSFGGMETINAKPRGDWSSPHLYVTRAQAEDGRTVTYGFADGTVITATVSADEEGCPAVSWVTTEPSDEIVPPSASYTSDCGTATITFVNETPWIYALSIYVDGELVKNLNVDGRVADGPNEASYTLEFPEDSGKYEVSYDLHLGAESDYFFGETKFEVDSNCEPNLETPVVPEIVAPDCDTDGSMTVVVEPNTSAVVNGEKITEDTTYGPGTYKVFFQADKGFSFDGETNVVKYFDLVVLPATGDCPVDPEPEPEVTEIEPLKPVFVDECGTENDRWTYPESDQQEIGYRQTEDGLGVEAFDNNAEDEYVIAEGATTFWAFADEYTDVPCPVDGTDGEDGQDGEDGTDGVGGNGDSEIGTGVSAERPRAAVSLPEKVAAGFSGFLPNTGAGDYLMLIVLGALVLGAGAFLLMRGSRGGSHKA